MDVGCAGHQVEFDSPFWVHGRLRREFSDVVGVDLSSKNVELMRQHGYTELFVQNAEALQLPGRFDTIVAGELIEHLTSPASFLRAAADHLAPGGRIVLTTPYPFSLLFVLYAFFKYPKTCQNLEHTCWFCPQTMMILADRVDLKVRHIELIEDYRPDVPARRYHAFVKALTILGPLVPARLRKNVMLVVLEPIGAAENGNGR